MGSTGWNVAPLGEWFPSPEDGTRLAFRIHDYRVGSPEAQAWNGIWVMNADGSGAAKLTEAPNSTRSLSWSPDGSQVVYLLDGDLWTVPAARGTAREIVHLPESEMLAAQRVP